MLNNPQKTLSFFLAIPLVITVNVSESWASVGHGQSYQFKEFRSFTDKVDKLEIREKIPQTPFTRPSRQTEKCRLLGDC